VCERHRVEAIVVGIPASSTFCWSRSRTWISSGSWVSWASRCGGPPSYQSGTKFSLFLNPLGLNEKSRIHRAALPYLKRDGGGDGWESVGEKVLHAREYDGISPGALHLHAEIVAQNIMPKTKESIPVMTILAMSRSPRREC